MTPPRESPLVDRSGTRLRMAGVGALLALTAAAAVVPEAPPARAAGGAESTDPLALRRADDFRRRFADYPGALFTPMGRMEVNGNPAELHVFHTADSLERVVNYYARLFQQSGRHVSVDGDAGAMTVSYYDESVGELVAVNAVRQGTGTLAFPSIMDASNGILSGAEYPAQLPLTEGAVTVSRVDDRTPGPSAMSTSVSQIIPGTPAQVADRFEKAMIERGYRSVGEAKGTGYYKDGERVSVSYVPLNKKDAPETAAFIVLEKAP